MTERLCLLDRGRSNLSANHCANNSNSQCSVCNLHPLTPFYLHRILELGDQLMMLNACVFTYFTQGRQSRVSTDGGKGDRSFAIRQGKAGQEIEEKIWITIFCQKNK